MAFSRKSEKCGYVLGRQWFQRNRRQSKQIRHFPIWVRQRLHRVKRDALKPNNEQLQKEVQFWKIKSQNEKADSYQTISVFDQNSCETNKIVASIAWNKTKFDGNTEQPRQNRWKITNWWACDFSKTQKRSNFRAWRSQKLHKSNSNRFSQTWGPRHTKLFEKSQK